MPPAEKVCSVGTVAPVTCNLYYPVVSRLDAEFPVHEGSAVSSAANSTIRAALYGVDWLSPGINLTVPVVLRVGGDLTAPDPVISVTVYGDA